jgi:hypothetical protein
MKELINSVLSSDLSFIHSSAGGIALAIASTVVLAIVSYCIFRAAIIGLKLASLSAVLYLCSSLIQLPGQDAKELHTNNPKFSNSDSFSDVRKEIKGLLESSKDNILPFVNNFITKSR